MRNRINVIATAAALAGTAAILAPNMSAAASPASSSLPRLTLALTSNSLTVGGKLQSGAVKVIMNVTGERHTEPVLFRLKPGVPFSAFPRAVAAVAAHNGDLNYLDPYGSIVFDAVANKGTSGAQTALRQGNYIAIDLASTKANPPHAAFTITRAAHPAKLPKPGATISAIDFTFHGPTRLHEGELVRFQNNGFLVHQIQGIGVKNAKAAKQLTALLLAGKDHQAKKLRISAPEFAGPLSTGGYQQETINQAPGVYVLVCIMRTQDGREQTQLGMERTIQIVK